MQNYKPKRLILIRHGESMGNIDNNMYSKFPDWTIHLTEKGIKQAELVGKHIKETIIKNESVIFYHSSFVRAKETYAEIKKSFETNSTIDREDPRLREQEWGHYRTVADGNSMKKESIEYGTFYYRFQGGESCADVYDRICSFLNDLFRDFNSPNCPDNVVIITHGTALRVFLMRWFRWTTERFESIKNPKNCEYFVLERNLETDKFELLTELRERN